MLVQLFLGGADIDAELKTAQDKLGMSYEEAKKIILEHEDILHKCSDLLLEKERISREEFESLWNEA